LGGFSAHAGQKDLLTWLEAVLPSKPRIVLTHGEDKSREAMAILIRKKYRLESLVPAMRETIEL